MQKAVDAAAEYNLDPASGDGCHEGQKTCARHVGAQTGAIRELQRPIPTGFGMLADDVFASLSLRVGVLSSGSP